MTIPLGELSKKFSDFSFSTPSPIGGDVTLYRPDLMIIEKTREMAKEIFIEAFETTYTTYYVESGTTLSIEEWLRLKDGLKMRDWLSLTFDEEYNECLSGEKGIIYLKTQADPLIAWASHSALSPTGELYLSQCCISERWRGKGIPSSIFFDLMKSPHIIHQMFSGIKEVKVITRKINTAANRLYTGAGLIRDETLDPSVYGDAYDDRYIGYRLILNPAKAALHNACEALD